MAGVLMSKSTTAVLPVLSFEGEALADDAGQIEGDVNQYLVVLFFGVEVEYAFERLRRGVGVERKMHRW